jgi:hypothetical protein
MLIPEDVLRDRRVRRAIVKGVTDVAVNQHSPIGNQHFDSQGTAV